MKLIPTCEEFRRRWIATPCRRLATAWVWGRRAVSFVGRAYRRPRYGILLVGATLGLLIPVLGLQYDNTVQGSGAMLRLPFVLTMVLCWLCDFAECRASMVFVLLLFAAGTGVLLFWALGMTVSGLRARRWLPRLCSLGVVALVVTAYASTWRPSVRAVRQSIAQECAEEQERGRLQAPDLVPVTPRNPTITYCFPVLPGIVASEHDFVYGPLMGGGSQDLWWWDGRRVRLLFCFSFWTH